MLIKIGDIVEHEIGARGEVVEIDGPFPALGTGRLITFNVGAKDITCFEERLKMIDTSIDREEEKKKIGIFPKIQTMLCFATGMILGAAGLAVLYALYLWFTK